MDAASRGILTLHGVVFAIFGETLRQAPRRVRGWRAAAAATSLDPSAAAISSSQIPLW
jgi:hypothetical protein